MALSSAVAAAQRTVPPAAGFGRSGATVVSWILLLFFLTAYVAMILAGEDFANGDHSLFTNYNIRGIDFPFDIWPGDGRFIPLALRQFNLIGRFTRSIAGFHAFQIAEILALVAILLVLDEQLSVVARSALAVIALLLPSAAVNFTGLSLHGVRRVVLAGVPGFLG
jgi:hypothetical protein